MVTFKTANAFYLGSNLVVLINRTCFLHLICPQILKQFFFQLDICNFKIT